MIIYGISRDYEGLDSEWFFHKKEDAEKVLDKYLTKHSYLDKNEFRILEIKVW